MPDDALPELFDKFYRVPGAAGGSRVGHRASAWPSSAAWSRRWAAGSRPGASELGGLAIDLDLPRAAAAGRAAGRRAA